MGSSIAYCYDETSPECEVDTKHFSEECSEKYYNTENVSIGRTSHSSLFQAHSRLSPSVGVYSPKLDNAVQEALHTDDELIRLQNQIREFLIMAQNYYKEQSRELFMKQVRLSQDRLCEILIIRFGKHQAERDIRYLKRIWAFLESKNYAKEDFDIDKFKRIFGSMYKSYDLQQWFEIYYEVVGDKEGDPLFINDEIPGTIFDFINARGRDVIDALDIRIFMEKRLFDQEGEFQQRFLEYLTNPPKPVRQLAQDMEAKFTDIIEKQNLQNGVTFFMPDQETEIAELFQNDLFSEKVFRSSTTNLLEDAETSDAQNELEKMMREIKKTASKLGPFATSSMGQPSTSMSRDATNINPNYFSADFIRQRSESNSAASYSKRDPRASTPAHAKSPPSRFPKTSTPVSTKRKAKPKLGSVTKINVVNISHGGKEDLRHYIEELQKQKSPTI